LVAECVGRTMGNWYRVKTCSGKAQLEVRKVA
jgi:hypothetical protein